jgi:hypothetical protein
VPHVVLHDAVPPSVPAARLGDAVLDGRAHGIQRPADGQSRDPHPHGVLGGVDERQVLRPRAIPAPDDDRDRRVAVPALDDRTTVDGQQVSVPQHPAAGDAVHDLFVDRGAQRCGETVVPQEARHAAVATDVLLGQAV